MTVIASIIVAEQIAEVLFRKPWLATLIGVLYARALRAQFDGVVWRASRILTPGTLGMCIGEVIVVKHGAPTWTITHEIVHRKQWKRYGTLPFVFAYYGSWLWNLVRYRSFTEAYFQNHFEREAYEETGHA